MAQQGDLNTIQLIAPRFMVDENDEYIINVILDNDGDIEKYENEDRAFSNMGKITPKRLRKLVDEFTEAARSIVNPPSGRDSTKPLTTDIKKPLPG
jgi:hypothetical protein